MSPQRGVLLAAMFCTVVAVAQEPNTGGRKEAGRRPSLADVALRTMLETESLAPPKLTEGQDVGDGDGPLVLMILRGKERHVEFRSLERGHADADGEPELPEQPGQGGAAAPAPADSAAQAADAKDGDAKAADAKEGDAGGAAEPARDASLAIAMRDGKLVLSTGKRDPGHAFADAEAAAIDELLAAMLRAAARRPTRGELTLEPAGDLLAQVVLTLCSRARRQGFERIYIVGIGVAPDPHLEGALTEMVRQQAWPSRPIGNLAVPMGELLILVDGPMAWSDVATAYQACARAWIFRIAFVGVAGGARYKLPLPVPVDR